MKRLVRAAILSAALAVAVLPEPAAAWAQQNPKVAESWRQSRVRSRGITGAVVVYVLIGVGRLYFGWRRRQVDFNREKKTVGTRSLSAPRDFAGKQEDGHAIG